MMHTRKENDGSIVIDIPYPIWEQLMNQGKEVEIYLPSQRTEGQWFNNIHYWYWVDLDLDNGLKKSRVRSRFRSRLHLDLDLDYI